MLLDLAQYFWLKLLSIKSQYFQIGFLITGISL